MITNRINTFPAKESIKDLGDQLKAEIKKDLGIYNLQIPNTNGKGYIKGVDISEDLSLIYFNCVFNTDTYIEFREHTQMPLAFLFNLKSPISHSFNNQEEDYSLNQYQHAILRHSDKSPHTFKFDANVEYSIYLLSLVTNNFLLKRKYSLQSLHLSLQPLFQDYQKNQQFYHKGFYNLRIADVFLEIESFKNQNFLNFLFLEAKCYELLTLHMLQYQEDLNSPKENGNLRARDIRMIEKAARLIHSDITTIRNVKEIAVSVGVNNNKLQDGFRQLYSLTVNSYIQKARMDRAKELLQTSDLSLSEIVDKIGLTSKSYFSKLFKEKYKTTPSEFRKRCNGRS